MEVEFPVEVLAPEIQVREWWELRRGPQGEARWMLAEGERETGKVYRQLVQQLEHLKKCC